jgi:hypothetical protein
VPWPSHTTSHTATQAADECTPPSERSLLRALSPASCAVPVSPGGHASPGPEVGTFCCSLASSTSCMLWSYVHHHGTNRDYPQFSLYCRYGLRSCQIGCHAVGNRMLSR